MSLFCYLYTKYLMISPFKFVHVIDICLILLLFNVNHIHRDDDHIHVGLHTDNDMWD